MHIPYSNSIHKISFFLIILLFSFNNVFAQTTFLSKVLNDAKTYLKANDIENAQKHYKIYLEAGGVKDNEMESFFNGLGQLLEKANQLYENKRYKEALSTLSTIPEPYCNTQWRSRCEEIAEAQNIGMAVTPEMCEFVNQFTGVCNPFVDGVAAITHVNGVDSTIVFDNNLKIVSSYSKETIDRYKILMANNGLDGEVWYQEEQKYLKGIQLKLYSYHKKINPHFKPIYNKNGQLKRGIGIGKDLFTLIDLSGKQVKSNIELYGQQFENFDGDIFWTISQKRNSQIQVMNIKGEILSECNYRNLRVYRYKDYEAFYPFCDGLSRMSRVINKYTDKAKREYCFYNTNIEMAFPQTFDNALDFSEGLAAVCKDGLWGYIDVKGNLTIPYKYITAGRFSNGLAAVEDKDGIKFINNEDQTRIVLPPNITTSFEGLDHGWHIANSMFSNGFVVIKKDGKYGYMDKFGNTTFDF